LQLSLHGLELKGIIPLQRGQDNVQTPTDSDDARQRPARNQEVLEQIDAVAEAGSEMTWKKPPQRLPPTFHSLAYRDFQWLWLGQVSHAFALWLEQIARPLLILALTDSATQLGLVILTRTIPAVVLGMVAGVVADNFNRRLVMLITKVVVLFLSAIFALLVVTGWVEVWHIYLFSFLRGATMAFDQPARRAMIPTIVPPHLVTNAMALSTGSMQVMRIVGASAAGLLMGYMGLAAPFVAIVFVYIFAVLFTWLLRVPDHQRSGYQGVRRMGGDFMEGLRFAWRNPAVRGVLIIALGYFTFGMSFMSVFAPLLATQVLDIGQEGFGYMMSVLGVGGVAGALVLATANPSKNRGLLMMALLVVFGVLLIALSAITYLDIIILAFFMIALVGFVQSAFFPLINSILIQAAPENMRGRVMGVLSLDRATMALGGAMGGIMSDQLGVQAAQIYFGLACVITAVGMLAAYPPLRRID
jgi:MFS family permease